MEEESAREYITLAGQLAASDIYCKAFDLYLLAFEKNPNLKALYEQEFRALLNMYSQILAHSNKYEEIFLNYGRATIAFPENMYLINDTGKYLYKFGFYTEAWCHFQKALKLDSGFVNAEKNLNSIKNFLVERWHYRMLNDSVRNESYHKAIKETLTYGKDSVLDLGSGTGLLSLYCMECSPIVVSACDASEQMVKMAECIFEDNNFVQVIIINNMSTDMDYRDIGGKKTLLVTELFDAGLFGEHILQSIAHAHEQLLSNNGRVLPNCAEFFIMGAHSDHLISKYQLSSAAKTILNMPSGNVHIPEEETYDCEDVYKFKDMKYMTEAQSLLKIDFNNYNDIQEKLNRTEPYRVSLKVNEGGKINVMIGWFNLHLSKNVTLTTDPRSDKRANAWQQVVFFDFIPQTLKQGQTLDLDFRLNGGRLTMVPISSSIIRIGSDVIKFLNDSKYVGMIRKCLGMASVYLGQMAEMSQICIADLCPFPLFGLLMLKRGVKSVTCCAANVKDKEFITKIFNDNNIPLSKVQILNGPDLSTQAFLDEKFHAVFCNYLDESGELCTHKYDISNHLKNAHLIQGGLFLPANVSLVAQVVNSHWLDINNRVYDNNTSNYKIGMYINKYQVSQNFCIDLTCLEYTPLTEPVVLGRYGHFTSSVVNVPIIKSGDANAILCWYNIEVMEGLGEISTKRSDSFVEATVFLANPPVRMVEGGVANVLRCIDPDGSFKLMIDNETT